MHDHFGEGGLKNYLNRQQRRDNIRKSTTVVAALIITWSGNVGRRNRIGTIFIHELILLFVSIRRLRRRLHPALWLDFQGRFQYACLRHLTTPHLARSILCFFYVLSVSQRFHLVRDNLIINCMVSLSTFRKVKELTHQGIVASFMNSR